MLSEKAVASLQPVQLCVNTAASFYSSCSSYHILPYTADIYGCTVFPPVLYASVWTLYLRIIARVCVCVCVCAPTVLLLVHTEYMWFRDCLKNEMCDNCM